MNPKEKKTEEIAGAVAPSEVSANDVVHKDPQTGGSFVRELNSGDLRQLSGPAPTEAPVQE